PVGSWYALMAGMGVFPQTRAPSAQEASHNAEQREHMRDFLRRCALNFRDHKAVLQEMGAA
ncbi:MAG: hypothetical protein WKG03_20960, partial [Telluria sp.]